MASTSPEAAASGPVLFAYDGSELAQLAIEQAGGELAPGRDALVLCVWQPADVGFVPVDEQHFDAQDATEVQEPRSRPPHTERRWPRRQGSVAEASTIEAAPTWKGIIRIAEQRQASLIVLGSHRRSGLVGHLLGSVAAAVITHSTTAVLVVRQRIWHVRHEVA